MARATAARALGDYGYVSDEAKERVLAAAAKLSYRPNELARSVASKRSRTLGVIVADAAEPFFGELVRGVSQAARLASFDVVVVDTGGDLALERSGVRALLDKRVDALVVASAEPLDGRAPHLHDAVRDGVPIVLVDREVRGVPADVIVTDSRRAIADAVGELAELGHERIALIWGPELAAPPHTTDDLVAAMRGVVSTGADRVLGYLDGHADHSLPVDLDLVALVPEDRAAGEAAIIGMLGGTQRPSAIVATDSNATLAALAATRAAGLRVPGDIAIVGFDETPWAAFTDPPLTMLDQSGETVGRAAMAAALRRIDGDEGPHSRSLVSMTIVRRGSVGPREV